jgi:hypothetical protein
MQRTLRDLSKSLAHQLEIRSFRYDLNVIGPKGPTPPHDLLALAHLELAQTLIQAAVKATNLNR